MAEGERRADGPSEAEIESALAAEAAAQREEVERQQRAKRIAQEMIVEPAQVPARVMSFLGRSFALQEALQGELAKGLKSGIIQGVDAARALASLTTANVSMLKLYEKFESKANSEGGLSKVIDADAAGAAARKLLDALDADDADEPPVTRAPSQIEPPEAAALRQAMAREATPMPAPRRPGRVGDGRGAAASTSLQRGRA